MEILSFKNNISTNFWTFILTLLLRKALPFTWTIHCVSSIPFCLFTHQTLSPPCTPFMGLEFSHIKMNIIGLCSNGALDSFGIEKYNDNNSKQRSLTWERCTHLQNKDMSALDSQRQLQRGKPSKNEFTKHHRRVDWGVLHIQREKLHLLRHGKNIDV